MMKMFLKVTSAASTSCSSACHFFRASPVHSSLKVLVLQCVAVRLVSRRDADDVVSA